MRWVMVSWVVLALAGAGVAGPAWFSQPFSAKLVQADPADPARKIEARLFVGRFALRLDQPAGRPSYIYDARKNTTLTLLPALKKYRVVRGVPAGLRPLMPGQANPCTAMFPNAKCSRKGTEQVNGRQAQRWEVRLRASGRDLVAHVWMDRQLGIWLRYVNFEGQRFDVVQLRFGPQPDSLFSLPPGYSKE